MSKNNKKGFFSLLLSQILYNEPQDQNELLNLIQEAKNNKLIRDNTYHMCKNIIHIEKKIVKNIMIPRVKMTSLKIKDNLKTCLKVAKKSLYSRFPVFNQNNSYLKGFLISKDLFKFVDNLKKKFILKKILKSPIIVPESQKLDKTLQEFYSKKIYIAVVVDEFGMITGLITLKDILRKIFKNINNTKIIKKKHLKNKNQDNIDEN
ncbi:CBS domain-containing protein [Buchnera aphidicola]|uniref:CBS domain-containing protein n=1 Tax=Buchnera aphidicola TaxID=9 RepID=UPI0020938309|nr:CBS domain-containing protein [Buchnera aphidicola]USS94406.1 CBS domain-containing protein [Buchnera aphidicola (Sipha maydis)]